MYQSMDNNIVAIIINSTIIVMLVNYQLYISLVI